jgi:two-component system response regulator HydG
LRTWREIVVVHPPRILLLSRDPEVVHAIQAVNSQHAAGNLQLSVCHDAKEAAAKLRKNRFAILLIHLAADEGEQQVLPLLWAVTSTRQACATVVLASCFSEEQVADLLRAGVADCLTWPAETAKVARVLQEILCLASPDSVTDPRGVAAGGSTGVRPILPEEDLVDAIPPDMMWLMEQVKRVAPQETTLLLTGETGTGKTRLARLIHQLSPRRDEPFLVVDCGSLSPSLIESELFGHAKGAFTGADRERVGKLASAGTGTLLLDEVNSLPLELQGKLLRAVEERVFEAVGSERTQPVRARLIAATNKPLDREVEAGRFRGDLYYRLNVVGFFLPPLRDRRVSIIPLAIRFLREFAQRNRPDVIGFTQEAQQLLEEYDWPGNIRELRNAVNRAAALCPGAMLDVEDLPESIQKCLLPPRSSGEIEVPVPAVPLGVVNGSAEAATLAKSKQEVEIQLILETLQKHNNNRLRAAAELGISRVALYKKLHKYGLMTPRYGKGDEPE